jgi:uncharacterized protein YoxC
MEESGGLVSRLQRVKSTLHAWEGRLRQLDDQLRVLRGQAEHATGRAGVRLSQAERQVRQAIEIALQHLTRAANRLEPQVQRALHQTQALRAGLRAGIKAGTAKYRETRPK